MPELTLKEIHTWFGTRPLDSHKGLFGHVLVVGGDIGMPGSVRLAAEGALRTGAGLVTVLTHPTHASTITIGRPELICYGVDKLDTAIKATIKKATMIVLGPGLGQSAWSKQLFDAIMTESTPKIIDADGLNWLAQSQYTPSKDWVLTPHPGEAARLVGCSTQAIQQDRIKAVLNLVNKYSGVVVLKGSQSMIATTQEPLTSCSHGNPGMASPGMGDLLSGIIAGCKAQGLTLWQAARAGVFIHAMAGDIVAASQGQRGLLASDLLHELPRLMNDFGQKS